MPDLIERKRKPLCYGTAIKLMEGDFKTWGILPRVVNDLINKNFDSSVIGNVKLNAINCVQLGGRL